MATGHTLPARKALKDVFYETRVLMGREYTLRRFAEEVLDKSVDPVMLGYIEKGKRFPSEELVRRLATVRGDDPHPLLVLLWRDRMLHGFGKELKKVMQAPRAVAGIDNAELAVRVSQAIAALPDDGTAIPVDRWRTQFREGTDKRSQKAPLDDQIAHEVETLLRKRGLVKVEGDQVRRTGQHYIAQDAHERHALAIEFCALFVKGLLEKVALPDDSDDTYLRNHYCHVAPERLPELQQRLDAAVREITQEFATDQCDDTRFLNVLVTATPL